MKGAVLASPKIRSGFRRRTRSGPQSETCSLPVWFGHSADRTDSYEILVARLDRCRSDDRDSA